MTQQQNQRQSTTPPSPGAASGPRAAAARREEAERHSQTRAADLDAGLEGTFPASDPVAASQPSTAAATQSDRPTAGAGDTARDRLATPAEQPHSRVNVSSADELRYWTRRFEVSEDRLREAVRQAGFFPADVAHYLGRSL